MSGQPVEFHPEALAEAEAALAWYQERSLQAAGLFASELDKAIEAISDAPHRWPIFDQGSRRSLLRRFPYFIVCREKAGSIQVLAVAHGRRRPGYWRHRVPEG